MKLLIPRFAFLLLLTGSGSTFAREASQAVISEWETAYDVYRMRDAAKHSPLPADSEAPKPRSDRWPDTSFLASLFAGSALLSITLHLALRHHRRCSGHLARVRQKEHLLNRSEQEFLEILKRIIPEDCQITLKVRVSDLFEVRPQRGHQPVFPLISGMCVPFIVSKRKSGHLLCGIELVAPVPQDTSGAGRLTLLGELFASHGIPLLRHPYSRHYDPAVLRRDLDGLGDLIPSC